MKNEFELNVKQKKISYRSIEISVPDAEIIARTVNADRMRITAEMIYDGEKFNSVFTEGKPSSKWEMELPCYGRWEVQIDYLCGDQVALSRRTDVGVAAEKYNIAPLIASMPVLIFSLKYFAEDRDGIERHLTNGDPIPTIVALSRYRQYDWDNLPEGMFPIPYLTEEDRTDDDRDMFRTSMPKITRFLRELLDIDSDSEFCFCLNGNHAGWLLPELIFYMGLKPSKYSLRFLSDGDGTDRSFERFFKKNRKMQLICAHEYMQMRIQLRRGEQIEESARYRLNFLAYTTIWTERNAEWWVISRDRLGDSKTSAYKILHQWEARNRIKHIDFKALINSIERTGHLEELYALYGCDDSAIKKVIDTGKQVMLVLGTADYFFPQDQICEYIKLTMTYYGDDYIYVYKGHPGSVEDEDRIDELRTMGVEIIRASVPTELILYSHPDIVVSGFPSTVFQSEISNIKIGGIFSINRSDAYNSNDWEKIGVRHYASKADFFASEIAEENDFEGSDPKASSHRSYLMEFNDGSSYISSIAHDAYDRISAK